MDLSRFEISGSDLESNVISLQNAKLIRLRWVYVSVLAVVAVLPAFFTNRLSSVTFFGVAALLTFLINGCFYVFNKKHKQNVSAQHILVGAQLLLDIILASLITFNQGGIDARTAALYAIPVTAAGLLFSELIVHCVAVCSGIGYVLSIVLYSVRNGAIDWQELLPAIIFYPILFIIYSTLVTYLIKSNINEVREQAYDSFLALLTHQLKRPASTASSIIDQLEHGIPDNIDKQKHYISILKSENQTLLHLLNNLLETAAFPSFSDKQEVVNLSRLLQRVAYNTAEASGRETDVKIKLPSDHLSVAGNSGRLSTALTNVLNNAFQYSPAGSPVKIDAHESGGSVIVSVEDAGKGLTEEAKNKLFKKYTLHENQEAGVRGLGLGLYVTKKIVQAYDGNLHIVSNKDGTKVMLILKKGTKK